MVYDLTQEIKDENGRTLNQKYKSIIVNELGQEVETLSSKPITLGTAIRDCILYRQNKPEEKTEEDILFAEDIFDKCEYYNVDLKKEEVSFIKKLVIERYLQHSSAQILRMLNK
jgi:hypothetical protein